MNIPFFAACAIIFLISFLLVYLVTPRAARKMKERGLTARDVNKADRPLIPNLGASSC